MVKLLCSRITLLWQKSKNDNTSIGSDQIKQSIVVPDDLITLNRKALSNPASIATQHALLAAVNAQTCLDQFQKSVTMLSTPMVVLPAKLPTNVSDDPPPPPPEWLQPIKTTNTDIMAQDVKPPANKLKQKASAIMFTQDSQVQYDSSGIVNNSTDNDNILDDDGFADPDPDPVPNQGQCGGDHRQPMMVIEQQQQSVIGNRQ